jgi:hypothetical protein
VRSAFAYVGTPGGISFGELAVRTTAAHPTAKFMEFALYRLVIDPDTNMIRPMETCPEPAQLWFVLFATMVAFLTFFIFGRSTRDTAASVVLGIIISSTTPMLLQAQLPTARKHS